MKIKKLLKNKWFWIAVIVVVFMWYRYNQSKKQTTTTATTGDKTTFAPVIQLWQGIANKVKYFVTLLAFHQTKFELVCQRSKEAGMDGIMLPIEIGRVLQPDGSYNWSEYDFAFQTLAKYNLLIDAKVMFQMTAGQAFLLKNIFDDNDFVKANDGRSDFNNFKLPSFSSPKWETVFYPFARAFCQRYKEYKDKGYVVCFKPSTAYTQEFCYEGMSLTDFSSYERQRYGKEIPGDSGNLEWYRFKTENLKRVFSNLAAIAKSYGYKVQIDNGSTCDAYSKLSVAYGAEYFAQTANIFKENPDFSYDIDFLYSRALSMARRKGAESAIEITWTGISDLNQRKEAFLRWVRRAADWGFKYVYFSFLDPSDLTAFNKMKEITSDLRNSGHLTKSVQIVNFAGSVGFTVSDFIQYSGHLHPEILNRFNAIKQDGKPVNIDVVYNL